MLQAFTEFVRENKLFGAKDHLLLAISGGEDSVCLFHLLRVLGYKFSVAHCNFQLRGDYSVADETFVLKLAKKHKITAYFQRFDTLSESEISKSGLQETARKLRYEWFDELMNKHGFNFLLTAHHRGDNSETMLINLLRSTGISGLHGIPLQSNRIVRPLMFTNREEISVFMKVNGYKFRLDKSNLENDYLRNRLRNKIIPRIKRIEKDLDQVLYKVSRQVFDYEELAQELITREWEKVREKKGDHFHLSANELNKIKHLEIFLYFTLRKYGFLRVQTDTIPLLLNAETGKRLESDEWLLIRERGGFTLSPKPGAESIDIKITKASKEIKINGLHISITKHTKEKIDLKNPATLNFDSGKCTFPLCLRLWKSGDKMQPLGMKGSKKISDILTDAKLIHVERRSQLVLTDAKETIMALLPSVISEQFKVDKTTLSVLTLHLKKPKFVKK